MTDEQRRRTEAADWFTRMNRTRVSNTDLEAFGAWRADPRNRAAYDQVEDFRGLVQGLRADPDIRAAAQAAREHRSWTRRLVGALRARPLAYGGAMATVVAGLCLLGLAAWGQGYSTGQGQQANFRLADGSHVRMRPESRVRVRFFGGERRIVLERGQAFFEVAHDDKRPFIVDAGRAEVRAVGTRFDVKRDQGDVEVVLLQGRVEVTATDVDNTRWMLGPGQQIRVGEHPQSATPTRAAIPTAATGRLIFHDIPLAEAVAEINRDSRQKIRLAANVPSGVRVNGVFDRGDAEGFASATVEGLDLTARNHAGQLVLAARTGGPT